MAKLGMELESLWDSSQRFGLCSSEPADAAQLFLSPGIDARVHSSVTHLLSLLLSKIISPLLFYNSIYFLFSII